MVKERKAHMEEIMRKAYHKQNPIVGSHDQPIPINHHDEEKQSFMDNLEAAKASILSQIQ